MAGLFGAVSDRKPGEALQPIERGCHRCLPDQGADSRGFIGILMSWFIQWLFLVPVKGGRDYITPQKAIYKWYILPIGGLYATYHLLGEPETTIGLL